jgi:hypothetical protein
MAQRRSVFRIALAGALCLLSGAAMAQSTPALVAAAQRGDAATVQRLLREGAPVDAPDASGRTSLLIATIRNDAAIAQLLIEAGADVNAQDRQRDSPFLYAGAEGRREILKMILAARPDLKSTNRYGGTALIPAAHHGHVETVRLLLTTAIDVDHINNLGWTALLETVILGDGGPVYQEIAGLLLGARANPNIADRNGITPLAHARRRGYREIARQLEAAGGKE